MASLKDTLLGTAPSTQTGTIDPFTEEQRRRQQEFITQLSGQSNPFLSSSPNFREDLSGPSRTGEAQTFSAFLRDPTQQFEDPNATFTGGPNPDAIASAVTSRGLRDLDQGLTETQAQFGGRAFNSQSRNFLARQQVQGIQDISERTEGIRFEANRTQAGRDFARQEAARGRISGDRRDAFGQNLQSLMAAQDLEARSQEFTQGLQFQGDEAQSMRRIRAAIASGQLTAEQARIFMEGRRGRNAITANLLTQGRDPFALVQGGSTGLLPSLIRAGGEVAGASIGAPT